MLIPLVIESGSGPGDALTTANDIDIVNTIIKTKVKNLFINHISFLKDLLSNSLASSLMFGVLIAFKSL